MEQEENHKMKSNCCQSDFKIYVGRLFFELRKNNTKRLIDIGSSTILMCNYCNQVCHTKEPNDK